MASKNISKLRKYIVHRHTSTESTTCRATHSGMPKLVVPGTFILVAQHLVRFSRFFEVFFGRLVPWIFIGMVLDRLLPVSLLYQIGRSSCREIVYVSVDYGF